MTNPIGDALKASAARVRVKPLEWVVMNDGLTSHAQSILGRWAMWEGHYLPPDRDGGIPCDDPISSAQADYETRILSALSHPVEQAPQPVAPETHLRAEVHLKLVNDHMPEDISGVIEYLREMACVHPHSGERRMPTAIDDAVFDLAAAALEKMQDALRQIKNPTEHFRQLAADEGSELDGAMAIALACDAEYLKGVARAALSTNGDPHGN